MNNKNQKALKLLSQFSISPNKLGYCGLNTGPDAFIDCIVNGKCDRVEKEVEQFIVLNPYLETLAEITGKPKFSFEVVEAYWIGNDLLKQSKVEHYKILMKNFEKQGVPADLVEEFSKNVPSKFIPHHLFQVLHIGVGRSSGSVKYNEQSINNCMPRWGKVLEIKENTVEIQLESITVKNNVEKTKKTEQFMYDEKFTGKINKGDRVSVHWNTVTNILTSKQALNLDFWTNEILSSVKFQPQLIKSE